MIATTLCTQSPWAICSPHGSGKVVCVDINPATVIKLSDRGTFQTIGLVTDVEPFLLARPGDRREVDRGGEAATGFLTTGQRMTPIGSTCRICDRVLFPARGRHAAQKLSLLDNRFKLRSLTGRKSCATSIRFHAAISVGTLVTLTSAGVASGQDAQPATQSPHDISSTLKRLGKVPPSRPEQKKTATTSPTSPLPRQGDAIVRRHHESADGGMTGFDFYKDPLGASKPGTTFRNRAIRPPWRRRQSTGRSSGNCWRVATTSCQSSTRRSLCRGASRSRSARPRGCLRGRVGPRWVK